MLLALKTPETLSNENALEVVHLAKQIETNPLDEPYETSEPNDLEIIYGRKNTQKGRKCIGFTNYDQATKDNFSEIIRKYDSLIDYYIFKFYWAETFRGGDRGEIKQVVLCSLYYSYYYYLTAYLPKGHPVVWWIMQSIRNTIYQFCTSSKRHYSRYKRTDIVPEVSEEVIDKFSEYSMDDFKKAISHLPKVCSEILDLLLSGFKELAISNRLLIPAHRVESYVNEIYSCLLYEVKGKKITPTLYADKPNQVKKIERTERNKKILSLHKQGLSIAEVSSLAGIPEHTVNMVLRQNGIRKNIFIAPPKKLMKVS